MPYFLCKLMDATGEESEKTILAVNKQDAINHLRGNSQFVLSAKEIQMAKKQASKKQPKSKGKPPAKIKHNEYIVIPSSKTAEITTILCPEPEIIKTAKEMLGVDTDEHTILIYQLVKKVSTSQEVKVQDV